MTIRQELLDILACPVCIAEVKLTPDGQGLKCVKCNRIYPIQDGIPVMIPEEANIEESGPKS